MKGFEVSTANEQSSPGSMRLFCSGDADRARGKCKSLEVFGAADAGAIEDEMAEICVSKEEGFEGWAERYVGRGDIEDAEGRQEGGGHVCGLYRRGSRGRGERSEDRSIRYAKA